MENSELEMTKANDISDDLDELKAEDFEIVGYSLEDADGFNQETISYWKDTFRRLRKNPVAVASMAVLLVLFVMCIIGPHLRGYDPITMNTKVKNQGSSLRYWFGTDSLGRDMFTRIWIGARVSVVVALVATALKLVIGTIYGAVMAHFGGLTDDIMMRIIEVLNSLPELLITILIMMIFGNNMGALLIALSVTAWCGTARQARGMIKQLKESEYVYAAEVMGASPMHIIIKHYIPNMINILLLDASTSIPSFIFTEAGLSFLGIGLTSPQISLGVLISQGQQTMDFYPFQLVYPCALLVIIVMAFNLFGEALRDAMDPKLRK